MKKFKNNKAFTLVEIILYTGIFAIVGGLMTGILLTVTQVQQRESASAEVTGQLNFVMQTVNRLIRESSNIEINAGTTVSTLKLRMQGTAKDPTCISLVSGVIKLAEGPGTNPNDCTTNTSDLTSDRVIVDTFNFKKFTQYPGHDTVSIDIQITYNSQNPKSQVQRTLSSAIARVSAATFDSNLLPGASTFEIGQSGSTWKNLYLSGLLNLGTSATDPSGQPGSIYYNTASSTFRGYKTSAWSNLGESLWTASGNNIYNANSGNVGIGTNDPKAALHVSGGVIVGNYATKPTCDANTKGMLVFDTTNNKPYVCANSATWKSLDTDFDSDGIVDWYDWDDTDAAKKNVNLTAGNIKSGIDIFGTTGSYGLYWTSAYIGADNCPTRCAAVGRSAVESPKPYCKYVGGAYNIEATDCCSIFGVNCPYGTCCRADPMTAYQCACL